MILDEKRLRRVVTSFLVEDLKFNGPYNDDFNITGVDESQRVIDLTKNPSARVYKFSRIFEALTNPDRQNVAAWKYVAEQMLENRGFASTNTTRSMPSVFGDTKKDECLYSVKSSFQKTSNTWNSVISQAKLLRRSLVDETGSLKTSVFIKNNCNRAGMIFCFRNDIAEDTFTVSWYKTPEVELEELNSRILTVFSKSAIRDRASIEKLFGAPQLYWQIILPNYTKGEGSYTKKLELYDMIDALSEDKYEALYSYIRDLLVDTK
jgi:hypothetical protein